MRGLDPALIHLSCDGAQQRWLTGVAHGCRALWDEVVDEEKHKSDERKYNETRHYSRANGVRDGGDEMGPWIGRHGGKNHDGNHPEHDQMGDGDPDQPLADELHGRATIVGHDESD